MTQQIQTNSHFWPSKAAAKADFKRIKDDLDAGSRVVDPEDDSKLRDILERHPDYSDKVGAGVDYFYVELTSNGDKTNVRRDAKGIWIRRVDGSSVDFSYITCVDQHSPRSDAKEGLRAAIEGRRRAYRESRFSSGEPVLSDISGTPITDLHDASVVYLNPAWEQLTFQFAESVGGWEKILVHGGGGSVQIGSSLLDASIEQAWIEFFDAHAQPKLALASEASRRRRSDERGWTP